MIGAKPRGMIAKQAIKTTANKEKNFGTSWPHHVYVGAVGRMPEAIRLAREQRIIINLK